MTPFWRDKHFVLAFLAGPLTWAGLFIAGFNSTGNPSTGFYLLLPVVIYPLVEEWFFRGTLQPALASYPCFQKKWKALTLANILTSVVFASLHLFNQTPLWAFLVFFPSLIFGWSMDRYKTMLAPVVLHVFYNAGFFLLF